MLNMVRTPLCPSSGAHNNSVGYHIGCPVLELLLVEGQAGWMSVRTEGCNTTNRQQLQNQTAYALTNTTVMSS